MTTTHARMAYTGRWPVCHRSSRVSGAIKIAINRNLRTHRVEVSAKPLDGLELSVDYYHFADHSLQGGRDPLAEPASAVGRPAP